MHSRNLIFILLCIFYMPQSWSQVGPEFDDNGTQNKPLWELGAIGAAFNTPEYPGASQNQNNAIVAPYFVYRGEIFRVGDGSAARAVAVEKDWIEVDLSLDAGFNANSSEDSVRAGMPDLDYVFEIGPQVRLKLFESGNSHSSKKTLSFKIQTRAAFSTDFGSIDHRGYVFHPELTYQQSGWLQEEDRLTLNLSPVWATEKLHDYFYQVDQAFVTEQRALFDARSGYLGFELSVGYGFDATSAIRVFMGAAVDLYQGSVNEDSPLLTDLDTVSVAAGLIWRFTESQQKANY
ncbi:MAG: hypothetical protein Alis3KO_24330 [Aliiglaciecola sp.]